MDLVIVSHPESTHKSTCCRIAHNVVWSSSSTISLSLLWLSRVVAEMSRADPLRLVLRREAFGDVTISPAYCIRYRRNGRSICILSVDRPRNILYRVVEMALLNSPVTGSCSGCSPNVVARRSPVSCLLRISDPSATSVMMIGAACAGLVVVGKLQLCWSSSL